MGGGYLLDTNVISEENKPEPNPGVMEWIAGVNPWRLYLSVLVLGEARRGVEKGPDGRKKKALQSWLEKWEGLAVHPNSPRYFGHRPAMGRHCRPRRAVAGRGRTHRRHCAG